MDGERLLPNTFVRVVVAVGDAPEAFPVHPAHGRGPRQAVVQTEDHRGAPEAAPKQEESKDDGRCR